MRQRGSHTCCPKGRLCAHAPSGGKPPGTALQGSLGLGVQERLLCFCSPLGGDRHLFWLKRIRKVPVRGFPVFPPPPTCNQVAFEKAWNPRNDVGHALTCHYLDRIPVWQECQVK